MRPTWSIAVKERLQELFCEYASLMLQNALALDVIQIFDGSYTGTIFNPAKVNTVPCMFTATLSLG